MKKLLHVKFVIFDIDDTLFPSTEFASLARKNAINAMISMGLEEDSDSLYQMLMQIIEQKGSNYQNHFDELCKRLKVKDRSRFVAAAVAAYHDTKTSIAPYPKVPLTLMRLRQMGFKLAVATSGSSLKQWDKLIRLKLALYFDHVFISEDLGVEKGTSFYKKVIQSIGAIPEECIMVGDRVEKDILPARSAGMHTAYVVSGGKYSKSSSNSKCDFTISDISELLVLLKSKS